MSSPSVPNPNTAAIQGATQNIENFPFQDVINALSQLGGSATVNGQNYDFSGLGAAQNASVMSNEMAQTLLGIQQNFGPQYVQQSLQDLQQSDPVGYAARQQLFDQIQQEAQQAPPNGQMSQDLQTLVNNQLSQAGQLTTGPGGELEQVQQGVRGQQAANGITLGNAAATQEADAVEQAGQQQQQQVQSIANQYESAGISPEDIQYRQIQQALGNLGAFQNNQTPEAEFSSLSGAQGGAAPFNTGGYSNQAGINTESALQGILNANQLYSGQVNWAQSQINPWTAGLSTLGASSNLFAGLGYSPFSSPTTTYTGTPNVGGSLALGTTDLGGPSESSGELASLFPSGLGLEGTSGLSQM